MRFLRLFAIEFRRQWQQLWSYRFDLLGDLMLWSISLPLLMLLFSGVTDNYGPNEQMATLIGFLVWNLTVNVLSATTRSIVSELSTGTLESVLLSPLSPLLLISMRVLASFAVQVFRTAVLGILLVLILGLPVLISGEAVVILIVTVLGAFGVSLVLGGVALIYKQIGSLIGMVSLLALLFTGALVPLDTLGLPFTILKLFTPITWGIDALRQALLEDASWLMLWHDLTWIGLTAQSVFFLLTGIWCFRWGLTRAKRDGSLGTY